MVPNNLQEILARGWDPIYFAEEIMGVRLNRAQRPWFELMRPIDGWQWPRKRVIHVAANQIGKTVGLALLIAWANHNKIGVNPADHEVWLKTPYQWFHLAPDQQTAYLTLDDLSLLVKGEHPAQYDKETGEYRQPKIPKEFFNLDEKVEQYYRGVTLWNGAVIQFRTSDEKARALQGRRAHGISFDEAAYENHLQTIIDATLEMRLISTGGPLWLVSTPNGLNDYYEIVSGIKDRGRQADLAGRVWVTDDAEALVWSTIYDNEGYGLSADEIARKENTLGDLKEQALRGAFLEPSEAYFVPSKAIEAAFHKIPDLVPPIPGRKYIICWDPSVASDPTAGYVIDVTEKPWRVVREVWEKKPGGINTLIAQMGDLHASYGTAQDEATKVRSSAFTVYDETGMGGSIVKQLVVHINPRKGLNFGGTGELKRNALGDLRAALMEGRLVIPDKMIGLKRELLNYRIDDKDIQQDRVMALAIGAYVAGKNFSGVTQAPFSVGGRTYQPQWRASA